MTAIEFRPRSISELVDASFQVVRQHFGPLAVIAALTAAPSVVLNVVTTQLADSITNPAAGTVASPARAFLFLPITLIGTCWSFVGLGALVTAIADACADRAVTPAAAFRRAFSRAWTLIGAHLLVYLIAFGAIFLGVAMVAVMIPLLVRSAGAAAAGGGGAPGAAALIAIVAGVTMIVGLVWALFAVARYYVVAPSVMLEGLGARASLRRSRSLTAGHVKRILGMLLLIAVVGLILYGTLWGVTQAMTRNRQVVNVVIGALAIPLYPLLVGLMTLLYYDLRIRKEGYDIELMAQQIGGGGTAGGSGTSTSTTPPLPEPQRPPRQPAF